MSELIVHSKRVMEVLRDKVKKAFSRNLLDPSELVEFYIVNLLEDFHSTEKFFKHHAHFFEDKPLSIQLMEAMSGNVASRSHKLKWIGDSALVMAGFYRDNISRGILKPSFYVSIGESAYSSLSDIHDEQYHGMGDMYAELSADFAAFVDVLSAIAPWNVVKSPEDVLSVYERWEATGDEGLRQILVSEGVLSDKDKDE